jgi:dual specificity protein kinase YAK1
MDPHWQSPFSNTVNHPTRPGAGGVQVAPLQLGRDTGGQAQQHHISSSYDYDSYQSASAASNGLSMASTPSATSHSNEYNGETDVPMEDADPYNRSKYPSRPVHQRGSSTQYLTHQGSSAAQRYSPMDMLSPSGYGSSPKSQSQNSTYQNHSSASRQSPTRQNYFPSASQQYQESPSKSILSVILLWIYQQYIADVELSFKASARYPNPYLPPIQSPNMDVDPYHSRSAGVLQSATDPREIRPPREARQQVPGLGPVPRFQKVQSVQELQPRINVQPPFRRANPEGGFISVSLTCLRLSSFTD